MKTHRWTSTSCRVATPSTWTPRSHNPCRCPHPVRQSGLSPVQARPFRARRAGQPSADDLGVLPFESVGAFVSARDVSLPGVRVARKTRCLVVTAGPQTVPYARPGRVMRPPGGAVNRASCGLSRCSWRWRRAGGDGVSGHVADLGAGLEQPGTVGGCPGPRPWSTRLAGVSQRRSRWWCSGRVSPSCIPSFFLYITPKIPL